MALCPQFKPARRPILQPIQMFFKSTRKTNIETARYHLFAPGCYSQHSSLHRQPRVTCCCYFLREAKAVLCSIFFLDKNKTLCRMSRLTRQSHNTEARLHDEHALQCISVHQLDGPPVFCGGPESCPRWVPRAASAELGSEVRADG